MCNDSSRSMHHHHVNDDAIHVRPVGVIKSQFKHLHWVSGEDPDEWKDRAAWMEQQRQSVSEIVVNEDLKGILDGIEEFSHLTVLFWGDQVLGEKRFITRVHPLGNPAFPLTGVFATHSPVRPNPILMTVVKLLERNGNVLKVSGLDALDGSPLLDIKPFNSTYDNIEALKLPDWMKQINRRFSGKECAETAD